MLALYFDYTHDKALLQKQYSKAKALARWLLYRRKVSLGYPATDSRHGIPFGDDEADTYVHNGGFSGRTNPGQPFEWLPKNTRAHHYSAAAEMYRAFTEIGRVWEQLGGELHDADMTAHGEELLATAPLLRQALHASLNRTLEHNAKGERCWAHKAEKECGGFYVRTYPEMFYSGALTPTQMDDIYKMGAGTIDCKGAQNCSSHTQFLQLGCPAGGSLIFTCVQKIQAMCTSTVLMAHYYYESYELNKSYLVSGFTVGIVGLSYIYIYIHIYRHFSGAKAAAVLAGKWAFTVKHIFRRELTYT